MVVTQFLGEMNETETKIIQAGEEYVEDYRNYTAYWKEVLKERKDLSCKSAPGLL